MTVSAHRHLAPWAWIGAAALTLAPAWAQTAPEGTKFAPPQQRPIQGTGVRHVVTTLAPAPLFPITLITPPVAAVTGGRGEPAPAVTAAEALTAPDSPSHRPGPDLNPNGASRPGPASTAECVVVSLSAPRARPDKTWMDLTGDGLIVSAVDKHRVESALGRGNPATGRTAGPVRHCMAPALVTALLAPVPPAGGAGTLALVPIEGGWRLTAPDDRPPAHLPGQVRAPAR